MNASARIAQLQLRREAGDLIAWMKLHSKIGPIKKKPGRAKKELVSDVDFGDWLPIAKQAALLFDNPNHDLFRDVIGMAMDVRHRKFFIDFGKCLSGELDPHLWDKRDLDVAEIVLSNPRIRAKDAVRELEKRGHEGMSEENFRNWKSRLLKAKRECDARRLESRKRNKF